MPKRIRRSIFRTNKFQRPIVNLTIGLAIVVMLMMTVCIGYLYYDVANAVYYPQRAIGTMRAVIILSLLILPFILLAGIYWAYDLSNKVIGPFERIIDELDEAISKGKKGHIRARKGDRLAEEILKRINALIDKTK